MKNWDGNGEFDPESRSTRSIRDDRYSYIVRFPNMDANNRPLSPEQLMTPASREFYDLKKDPWEQNNLIHDERFADEIGKLANRMKAYGLETMDPRFTGDLDVFVQTRRYVQMRKNLGYGDTLKLPYEKAALSN